VWSVDISADGKTIASAGDERALVWNPDASKDAAAYGDHEHWVTHVAVSADGTQLASCSDYGDINVRSLRAGTLVAKLQITGSECEGLALRGTTLVAATGRDAQVFAIRDGAKPRVFALAAGRKYGSSTFAASTDGRYVASGGDDGRIAVHVVATGAKQWSVQLPANPQGPDERTEVYTLAFDRTGARLAAVAGDDLLRVYDAGTGRMIRSFTIKHGCGTGLTFTSGDRIAVACGGFGDILVYDAKGALAFQAQHRDGGVYSLAAAGTRLVAGGADGSLTVWDVP
jgi:WD40 repeat protein